MTDVIKIIIAEERPTVKVLSNDGQQVIRVIEENVIEKTYYEPAAESVYDSDLVLIYNTAKL